MSIRELEDSIIVDGKEFPKEASREELEKLGAIYLRRDSFPLGEERYVVEYMVIEEGYGLIWKRLGKESELGDFDIHLFMPEVKRF